jgi:hypothetical protein
MEIRHRLIFVFAWVGALALLMLPASDSQTGTSASSQKIVVPKIWDLKELATWGTPIAGINATENYYTEEEYYQTPVDNTRTYPVYHPDYEPKGYRDWLKKQGPQPLIEPARLKTEADWIEAGRRVFDELDVPTARTGDPRAVEYFRDRAALKKDGTTVAKGGIIPGFRWVVEKSGEIKLGLSECSGCHTRVMSDGTIIRGAQGNIQGGGVAVGLLTGSVVNDYEKEGKPPSKGELSYAFYGVPWLKDDIHEKFKTMSEEELSAVNGADISGTVSRFNSSPYYTTKIPDLIGIKDRRYLDHTGTHLNRGPADIARYAAYVAYADDGAIGPYKFLSDEQRRLKYRYSDEALFALGMYIYSLAPPANPNKVNALTRRGEQVFRQQGCAMCHTPPLYTNNMLIPVDGFEPPSDAATQRLHILSGVRVGTETGLALRTRKGTGYYKVPSLRGLWYRGLIEHSGSIASLEDWFNPERLRDNFEPSGWKGPNVVRRAVKGHEFGLSLSASDKRALIAFLRTL